MKSELALGNKALKNKNYTQALKHYYAASAQQPELAAMIQGNIKLVEKKLGDTAVEKMAEAEKASKPEAIDIVVPVYNALEDVKLCLQSLARHTDGFQVRVLVVNDGSDTETTTWLREYCKGNTLFHLIEHPVNKGYTCTVNTGLRASTADYVITQNSDTIVPAGWLTGMVRCIQSDPKIGVVGPLSNAATWQNVPKLRDESGGFAVNDLPPGHTVGSMAQLVASASSRQYPRMPFVNGFCFMIRRALIEAIGYMDEENFPVGYGEENDFCIRATDAGFDLAIADDVYVYHAKSKSFGHALRRELSEKGTASLKRKHTSQKYYARVQTVKKTEPLDAVRLKIQAALNEKPHGSTIDLMNMRILFLLPVKGGGGGAHSVVQEVTEMRRLGLYARVGVKNEQVEGFVIAYSDIDGSQDTFVGFDDNSLIEVAESYDIVVGTIFSSMKLVKRITDINLHILPAYYVQDYEPMFFAQGSYQWKEARDSYTLVPEALLFAKTQWIIDEVKREHSLTVHKVQPSIDHEVYKPVRRDTDDRLNICAMIRPQTPRRGAERTMLLLAGLHKKFGDSISIHIFGCSNDHPEFSKLETTFEFMNHGPLQRPQVAKLLAQSDLFIDLSDYQAFGRTALEAMACGCTAVVPKKGGVYEYAIHRQNSLILDSQAESDCLVEITNLLENPEALQRMSRNALFTAARYSVHAASVSEIILMESALKHWREKPSFLLLPSRKKGGSPAASGYVRVVLPWTSSTTNGFWRSKQIKSLPNPGCGQVVLIQRDVDEHTLETLKEWMPRWKRAGGKILYEIDDDLFDVEGLRARHYSGDMNAMTAKVRFLAGCADAIHVSTEPLAERLRQLNSNVFVIPNALNLELWRLDKPRQHDKGSFSRDEEGLIRIGYIGTPTHDEDLNLIAAAMNAIKGKYGASVEIEVIGGFQSRDPTFGKRVGLPKKNDYPDFVRWLLERCHWDIGVIPLVDNNFNRSKSYLKFLEYAALDMAIVVSDVPSYAPVAKHGVNCLLAKPTTEDWVKKLTLLIEDEVMRNKLAHQARIDCASKHTLQQIVPRICVTLNALEIQGVVG